MERERFEEHFAKAAAEARDFAKKYVRETLPDAMRFRVRFNRSYDGHATSEFTLFSDESGRVLPDVSSAQAIDALWRDGMVPQWIDVAVIAETGDATVLELDACGRFIADASRLYYTWTPVPPFGVKGPALPGLSWPEGDRFSLYHRTTCFLRAELERAQRLHAEDVTFLELNDAFDDDDLERARFPNLEIVWLLHTNVKRVSVEGMPKLRGLRIVSDTDELDMTRVHDPLEHLEIHVRTARVRGTPRAKSLTLRASERFVAVDEWPTDGVEKLTLDLPEMPKWIRGSPSIRECSLNGPYSDDDVEFFLATCDAHVMESVSLRRTHVTERALALLEHFPNLRFLDVVGTRVPRDALDAFAAKRPKLRRNPR